MHRMFLAGLVVFASLAVPFAFAEADPTKIISECETIYPELETLGKTKFLQRYAYHSNIRSCITLYNDIIWFSDDSDRTDRLIALLGEPIMQKQIRDRYEQTVNIPSWIKNDAMRWQQGKEHDNIFSYGIRFMIKSKMIDAPITLSDQVRCASDQICVSKNNYIKYSIKDSKSTDVTNLIHTFGTSGSTIAISSVETTREEKKPDNFHIDSDGLVDHTKKYYRFVHKIPSELGTTINSEYQIKTTSAIIFPFKNQQRDAVIAWDKTRQYQEVIDKNTGILLSAKHHDRIKKTEWTAELTDTNAFSEEIKIQYDEMRIPSWFKAPVKWWAEGKIPDSEYISSINYLLKNNIMQI
ncbi:MAG: hypothetical protein ACT4OD_03115 [Candidatus Nitrosotenuis sp.]